MTSLATLVNAFCRDHLNAYLNFHRPCLFAETITDAKGRQRAAGNGSDNFCGERIQIFSKKHRLVRDSFSPSHQ